MSPAKCSATTRAGVRCTKYAMPGKAQCGYHGGAFDPVPAHGQPLLEDGTVDVRALCKRWDEDANRGAGEPRESEAANTRTMGADNRNGPGTAQTVPGPASPAKES